MAPTSSINHFIHPNHPLKPIESDKEYLCDGCKTLGTGKRYRCASHGCDFDMHEYCGTCPNSLPSSMHKHALTLVLRKPQASRQIDRICDFCAEPVEGLFYRCKECEFDVHPLCTQFPDKLNHAMHTIHPLRLESPSIASSVCDVCRKLCNGWRYRCGACDFDIHLQCVLVPAVKCPKPAGGTSSRGINPRHGQGIPYQPPPQFAPYYYYYQYNHAFAYGYGYGQPQMNPHGFTPQNQQVSTSIGSTAAGRVGKSMFALVGQIGFGVISNMIFGMDLTSLA